VHPVKQRKINMMDGYFGLQVFRQPAGHLPGYPILAKGCLNENIYSHDKQQ
jgi:hypothetical protein